MLDRFAATRGLGFQAVECQLPYDHPAEELARACGDEKLRFVMFNAPLPGDMEAGEYGISDLSGREAEFPTASARRWNTLRPLRAGSSMCLPASCPMAKAASAATRCTSKT